MRRAPRMLISTEGLEGSGKSDFALRGTPRPLTYLDFDYGTEGLGQVDVPGMPPIDFDGVHHVPFNLMAGIGVDSDDVVKNTARTEMRRFISEFHRAIKDKVRTLVVDTFTAAWAGQRVANDEVKKYAEYDEEFRSLIRLAYASEHTNLILIHHMKPVWAKSREGKSYKVVGSYERESMDGILTAVQLGIRQKYTPADPRMETPAAFTTEILKCRDNVGMTGMVMPSVDWQTLCTMACPVVDWTR